MHIHLQLNKLHLKYKLNEWTNLLASYHFSFSLQEGHLLNFVSLFLVFLFFFWFIDNFPYYLAKMTVYHCLSDKHSCITLRTIRCQWVSSFSHWFDAWQHYFNCWPQMMTLLSWNKNRMIKKKIRNLELFSETKNGRLNIVLDGGANFNCCASILTHRCDEIDCYIRPYTRISN